MREEQKSVNGGGRGIGSVHYQPDNRVPAGSVGKKDGNKTKLT